VLALAGSARSIECVSSVNGKAHFLLHRMNEILNQDN